jgi:hypothetical protein
MVGSLAFYAHSLRMRPKYYSVSNAICNYLSDVPFSKHQLTSIFHYLFIIVTFLTIVYFSHTRSRCLLGPLIYYSLHNRPRCTKHTAAWATFRALSPAAERQPTNHLTDASYNMTSFTSKRVARNTLCGLARKYVSENGKKKIARQSKNYLSK